MPRRGPGGCTKQQIILGNAGKNFVTPRSYMDLSLAPSCLESIVNEAGRIQPRAPSERTLQVLTDCSPKSPRSAELIAELRSGKAVCILTGQQLGLFLGPSYTIYK